MHWVRGTCTNTSSQLLISSQRRSSYENLCLWVIKWSENTKILVDKLVWCSQASSCWFVNPVQKFSTIGVLAWLIQVCFRRCHNTTAAVALHSLDQFFMPDLSDWLMFACKKPTNALSDHLMSTFCMRLLFSRWFLPSKFCETSHPTRQVSTGPPSPTSWALVPCQRTFWLVDSQLPP